jgi:hypothetical protein
VVAAVVVEEVVVDDAVLDEVDDVDAEPVPVPATTVILPCIHGW